jgi:DNA-binding XRE family transcriptional regulator
MAEAPNKISFYRKMRKMTQQMLASHLDVHVVTISNLERGQLYLSQEWMSRIAKVLQVEPEALQVKSRARDVYVGGFLTSSHMHFFGETEEYWPVSVGYENLTNDTPRWLYVYDNGLYPVLRRGDVVRGVTMVHTDKLHLIQADGKLCMIEIDNLKEPDVIGFVTIGTEPGTLNITPINQPPRLNVTPTFLMILDQVIYQPKLPPQLITLIQVQDEISSKS